jgi:hypothetical protein
MLSFTFRGKVADIDETTSDQPLHPSTLLLIEVGDTIDRVIVPASVLSDNLPLLCAGRPIELGGEIRGFPRCPVYIATRLRLLEKGH